MAFYKNVLFQKDKVYVVLQDGEETEYKILDYKPRAFIPTNNPTSFQDDKEGLFLEEIRFNNSYEKNNYLRSQNIKVFGTKYNEYDWITENFAGKMDYDESKIRVGMTDIEVDSSHGFPEPSLAEQEVQLITITLNGYYHVFGCGQYQTKSDQEIYYQCSDEKHLLKEFIKFWRKAKFDVISGWYIRGFDIPYLINRIRKLFGDNAANALSPWNRIVDDKIMNSNGMEDVPTYKILGISIMDYRELYMKFNDKPREDYKLDTIAYYELKEKKMDYAEYGNLKTLAKENFQKYTEYNIRDVSLIWKLEARKKFLSLAFNLAYTAKVNFDHVFQQTVMWDGIYYNYVYEYGQVPRIKTWQSPRSNYAGGYVKEPIPKLYGWTVSVDATSMYPSIMMELNISPETYRGKKEDIFQYLLDETNPYLDKCQGFKVGVAANGALFDNRRRGNLASIIENMFADRARYKDKMIELKQNGGSESDIATYNILQMTKKVCLNSAYGALGSPWFRFYEKDMAEAITRTAQLVIQLAAKKVNELLNSEFKTKDVEYVIYIDTDSLYINFDSFVDPSWSHDEAIEHIDRFTEEKIYPYFDNAFRELQKNMNAYEQKIFFKREAIADKAFFKRKKRYILNVLDNEHVRLDPSEIKITGIEAIKSATPEICRDALKESFRIMLTGTEEQMHEYITGFKQTFKQQPLYVIATSTTCNNIQKYSSSTHLHAKGAPWHVKGAINFNYLLNKFDLIEKYDLIKEGEKVKILALKTPNPMRMNVIAFTTVLPEELGLVNWIDYDSLFNKLYLSPLTELLEIRGWSNKKTTTLEALFVD